MNSLDSMSLHREQFSGKGKILMGEQETLQRIGTFNEKHRRGEYQTTRDRKEWPGKGHIEAKRFRGRQINL